MFKKDKDESTAITKVPGNIVEFNGDMIGRMKKMCGGKLEIFDLPAASMPSVGGRKIELGDDEVESFRAVILGYRMFRQFWDKPYKPGVKTEPVCICSNIDVYPPMGIGAPGGPCLECPNSKWGSAALIPGNQGSGKGQACSVRCLLLLYVEGEGVPFTFSLPPTALSPFKSYGMSLIRKNKDFPDVVTEFSIMNDKLVLKNLGTNQTSSEDIEMAEETFAGMR